MSKYIAKDIFSTEGIFQETAYFRVKFINICMFKNIFMGTAGWMQSSENHTQLQFS